MKLSYFMLMLLLVTSNGVIFKMHPECPKLVSFPRVDQVSVYMYCACLNQHWHPVWSWNNHTELSSVKLSKIPVYAPDHQARDHCSQLLGLQVLLGIFNQRSLDLLSVLMLGLSCPNLTQIQAGSQECVFTAQFACFFRY